ncbi:GntR family transcriptional regulator [Synergistales bacterium]|nr:GntR family transcriptional regulator [Synergistales bacterium]
MKQIVREESFREKVYKELKMAIIKQTLVSGPLLNERKLSEQLSVSRTPVREALQILEAEGWVVILPRQGFRVNPITPKSVREVMEARKCIECFLIGKAEMKISDEHFESIVTAFQKHKDSRPTIDASNSYKCAHCDTDFHLLIAKINNNDVMLKWFSTLQDKIERTSVFVSTRGDLFQRSVEDHEEILEALRCRDQERAMQAMKHHLSGSESRIVELFDQKN